MDGDFRILVVCTANICRSPMAEAMFVRALRARLPGANPGFSVASAGTHAFEGGVTNAEALRVLTECGVPSGAATARRLLAADIEGADLVLGLAREHRAAAVTLVPRAVTKTFTLREFARLAVAVGATADAATHATADGAFAANARRLVEEAARLRGHVRAARPADDDIADPYGRSPRVFRRIGQEIAAAVDSIAELLARPAAG